MQGILIASLVGLLVGSLTHELSHYCTARAAGLRAEMGLNFAGLVPRPETRYAEPQGLSTDRAVRYAPLASGVLVAAGWAGGVGTWPAWPLLAWWASHTLAGGAADYRPLTESLADPIVDEQRVRLGLFWATIIGLGVIALLFTAGTTLSRVAWWSATTLVIGLTMGVGTVGVMNVADAEEVSPR